MWSPFDFRRGRLVWTTAATVVIAWWVFTVLAAGSVAFFAPGQTLAKTVGDIADAFPRCVWPGEFGRYDNPLMGITLQFAPVFAAATWWLCFARWRTRRARLIAIACSMVLPCPVAVALPHYIVIAPVEAVLSVGSTWDGEQYEEVGVAAAVGLWW